MIKFVAGAALSLLVVAAAYGTAAAQEGSHHEGSHGKAAAPAPEDLVPEITPDFAAVKTAYDPKHTPKITAPEKVAAGEWFDVTIEIGKGSRHPSLIEHHVRSITLFKDTVELARAYLHPVHSTPKVTFTIRLEYSATLRAQEEPTHTAPWEASTRVEVER